MHFTCSDAADSDAYATLVVSCPAAACSHYCCCCHCRAKRAVRQAMDDDARDAIDNMTLIDSIYTAAGLPLRQPSSAHAAVRAAGRAGK
jgi:hypothetical protein